ncbi:MAG: hypothetical protein GY812_13160 [Actinomycetia bacterium]|nr:hypothetical protein [Actinomycetes bacterium]
MQAVVVLGSTGAVTATAVSCAPHPTMRSAEHTLRGLWDAAVPGTHNGVVQDLLADGSPSPGANQAGVYEWLSDFSGSLPPPADFLTDGFMRAWAADLDLWADWFHLPVDGGPSFGDLPLGPTFDERGRQYKLLLMTTLFEGIIDLKYFGGVMIAKMAFYGDFWAERTGADRVSGPLIGFPGPVDSVDEFTYNQAFGTPDPRMQTAPNGLVVTP